MLKAVADLEAEAVWVDAAVLGQKLIVNFYQRAAELDAGQKLCADVGVGAGASAIALQALVVDTDARAEVRRNACAGRAGVVPGGDAQAIRVGVAAVFVAALIVKVDRRQNGACRIGLGEGVVQSHAELGAAAGIPPAAGSREVRAELDGDGLLHRPSRGCLGVSAAGGYADEHPAEQGA